MHSITQIIHGGGFSTRRTVGKPKARFFGFLSLIWLFVAFGASFPFWQGWPQALTYLEILCIVMLVPLPILILLTIAYLLFEQPRDHVEHHYSSTIAGRQNDCE